MNIKIAILLAFGLLLAGGGYLLGRGPADQPRGADQPLASIQAAPIYQCPMHPWITSNKPGDRCTICGMDLVAVGGDGAAATVDPDRVTLNAAQVAVTGVATSEVTRGALTRTLRVSGIINDDDTRHRILAARVPGRIETLQVNYVGAEVAAGAPLATVFSPEMLTAQRQYVERLKAGDVASPRAERAAARERLLELGLTEEEIRILDRTLKPTAMVNIRAPLSGTVVSRAVYEGQYVKTNDPLFEIGDFSRMWFVFDAYEPDLAWLRLGQTVEVSVPSLPGQVLTAPISFIDPNLDEQTRTARVRVILENPERRLRYRQTAQALVSVTTPDLLLVPRAAVLQHSGRPIVYLDLGEQGYRAREIRLGRVGDSQAEVLGGLNAGDRVVTTAALILDAQAQLAHAGAAADPHQGHVMPVTIPAAPPPPAEAAYGLLRSLAFATADGANALAADDLAAYQQHLPAMRGALAAYLAGDAAAARGELAAFTNTLAEASDLEAARRAFEPFSTAVADLARTQHLQHREPLWIYQCPMTPVLGTARWLSRSQQLRNPFFGSAMLECGDAVNE
ncbi:efflux RND transporter periplasmic adaptor subunit [uncultured Lamprocystis sp.]|jgi:Cu(I)/Ag(I) efflux system membrane fusion protein|uniref:efflux RND transporter periplasmic adaptor subunit n=1 Tax=uncultured Lamprocystis sp. TaxID=543132 RepID=UPI0025E97EE6|nr:efflux RND transporter periplasmic adaptor subunit [uncultured Lamprocystis sp.]